MKYCHKTQFQIKKIPCIFWVEKTLAYKIIDLVSQYCEIPVKVLKGPIKSREVAEARQLALYFIKNYNAARTLEKAGILLNRDHSTVLNSERVVLNLLDTDKYFKGKYDFLKREIDSFIK